MTRIFCVFLCTVSLLFVSIGPVLAWEGAVVKVLDGDSMKVKNKGNGRVYEIRLYGIDTPEYRQPYSNKARQLTRRLVLGKEVSVRKKDIDRYDRIVALVSRGNTLVNRELVRNGLAWFYGRYCLEQPLCDELKTLEAQARKQKRGLWRDRNPVSPWEWKHGKKTESYRGFGK